ncbi:MAG: preprotein translocase subunit SecA [Planctomycetaceae bacterium]|nr:preprotein translocase subunit SecA [Planctomycetaceae bacterium]
MGFFDALFGSKKRTNVEVVPDHIWMTTDAKFAGLAKEAEERSKSETVAILLVAHFPDVLERLEDVANKRDWSVPCRAVPASNLDTDLAASLKLDESAIIDVIVGERHPLPSVDDGLEAFADHLPCRCRFSHHLSLDDPVLEIFGGEWVKNVLRQMGMTEDEAIESQMVSRRIRQAQQKIEGRAYGNFDAESAAHWLEKNCPELTKK